jgi:hypothetical protein
MNRHNSFIKFRYKYDITSVLLRISNKKSRVCSIVHVLETIRLGLECITLAAPHANKFEVGSNVCNTLIRGHIALGGGGRCSIKEIAGTGYRPPPKSNR